MSTEIGMQLLTVERDRLKEMIEELEEKSNFVWDNVTCPVCKESEKIGREVNCGKCSICWKFGISDRCDWINKFWCNTGKHDKETGKIAFASKETEYLQDLFANYIRQVNEQLEELK